MDLLIQKIITTITYYDVLDYPMTSFEIWKYLIACSVERGACNKEEKKCSLLDIINALESEKVKKHVEQYQGYYFLKGRRELVGQRIEKNKIAQEKFKKVSKVVGILRFIPFVRMVAVTGTLAMKNTDRSSDLDLLVVLKSGHIFTGRTLVTGMVHLLGVRRYEKKISNRVCLNFFLTDQSLDVDIKDLFSSSEYYFIWPLFGRETFRKFQNANEWIGEFRENFFLEEAANLKMIDDHLLIRAVREVGEFVLSSRLIEDRLKKWQIERIKKDPRTHLGGSMVMADDNALIFLPEPQGPGVYGRFKERLEKLAIADLK